MPDINLDDYQEITNLNFDGDAPHLAICHKSQGWSANLRHKELLTKSSGEPTQEVKDIMKNTLGQDVEVLKVTANGKRNSLESALMEYHQREMKEYDYLYVMDYNDEYVVYRYKETYAMKYMEDEQGMITLEGEPMSVVSRDLYVDADSGEELVKAATLFNTPDTVVDGEETLVKSEAPLSVQEDNMSDKLTTEELLKSAQVQELLKAQVAEALAAKDAEIAKAKLEADTSELVKGFSFVEEAGVSELVKSLMGIDQPAEIVKALTDANTKIESLEAEIVKVKEDFAKPQAIEGEVDNKNLERSASSGASREEELKKAVAAKLAERKAAK